MAKTSNLVALITFTSLSALAYQYILGNAVTSGFFDQLGAQCHPGRSPDLTPYLLPYTGTSSVDEFLCAFVTLFHVSFEPQVLTFLIYFIASASPILAHAYFESYRPNRPLLVAFPLIFAQVMQVLTFGVTFAIYWLVFVLSGAATPTTASGRQTRLTISKGHAQAVLFGLFIGMVVLSGCMVVLQDPYITLIWQFFPAAVSVASLLHLLVRPASKYPDSGYITLQGFYVAFFIVISSLHTTLLMSKSTDELKALFIPSLEALPKSTSIELQTLNFLQLDLGFGVISSLLGTLWFGRNKKEALGLLAWNLVASPVVGPGAAFAAVALWREGNLLNTELVAKSGDRK